MSERLAPATLRQTSTFSPLRCRAQRHFCRAGRYRPARRRRGRRKAHPVRAGTRPPKPAENLAAYGYLLRGREFLSHAARDKNDKAAELFQRAIELDPNYAAGYAALGGSHFEAVVSGRTEFRQEELEQPETLAQKARALDPMTTNAYRPLAFISMYKRRYDLALGRIDHAIGNQSERI